MAVAVTVVVPVAAMAIVVFFYPLSLLLSLIEGCCGVEFDARSGCICTWRCWILTTMTVALTATLGLSLMLAVVASVLGDAGFVVNGNDSGGGGDGVKGDTGSLVDGNDGGGGRGRCSEGDGDLLLSSFSIHSDRMAAEVEFDARGGCICT
ncbi:hypothetical protein RIF29_19081 [Crotalaria pallida]|uniref:Uncharacterized protein n=1 Tax=Crotalaria pallida TaxID=3830 RepID=A0AAN9I574_CROPI